MLMSEFKAEEQPDYPSRIATRRETPRMDGDLTVVTHG